MKKVIIAVMLMSLLSVPAFAKKDAVWVVKNAKVENDAFAQATVTTFPKINYRQMGKEVKEYTGVSVWSSPNFRYYLVTEEKAEQPTIVKIMVKDERVNLAGRKSFNNYSKAIDNTGKELQFVSGAQLDPEKGDIKNAVREERFSIILDEDYLKSHKNSGIVIKVYGDTENPIFHVSPWYIEGILNKLGK